ncbi:PilZ domain-containing protein [Novosphingobium sp. 9]|uniref:PilZ domain-containing protein n=1 Tax=Novosphingobium sp. 9 TaxID=2025349 RepID=UPI0021B5FC28|nr:PilZ domain-containing protein [Novosphingobium sp. 9]
MTQQVPRSSPRHPVRLAAHCRTLDGQAEEGELFDISLEGCCVRTPSGFFRVGGRVVVLPEGLDGQSGIVRWSRGEMAGVEFDQPVRPMLVEELAARHGVDVLTDRR